MSRVRPFLPVLVAGVLAAGCASVAPDLVPIGENAWRVTTIDNTEAEAARTGINQANEFCAKMGKAVVYSASRETSDMPARHILTMEFQCTARGDSEAAQAEARMLGYRRDCAIAGFPLGSPENIKCAQDVAAKASPRAAPAR